MVLPHLLSFLLLLVAILPAEADNPEITIGVTLSLSAKYATMGDMQARGFHLWQSHVNARKGILGRPIRMVIHDDQSNPERAKVLYARMIEKTKVDLVFGPYSSEISEAVLPLAETHQYPLLISGASSDRLWAQGYQYAFGVYTPASKYTVGFLELLVRHKITQVAIVSADDAFSVSLSDNTRKWAHKFRLQIQLFERFPKDRDALAPLAIRIKNSGAQALIVCGHLEEAVNMRRALKQIDWHPRAYYASVGPATQKYYTLLGKDAGQTFSSSQWEESVGRHFPQSEHFIQSFYNTYQCTPSYHAATAYASGMIMEEALRKLGKLDRTQLRDTLSALDTMTVIGRYGVDKTGWQIRHFPLIVQWQGHQREVVWPEKLRTTAPVF